MPGGAQRPSFQRTQHSFAQSDIHSSLIPRYSASIRADSETRGARPGSALERTALNGPCRAGSQLASVCCRQIVERIGRHGSKKEEGVDQDRCLTDFTARSTYVHSAILLGEMENVCRLSVCNVGGL